MCLQSNPYTYTLLPNCIFEHQLKCASQTPSPATLKAGSPPGSSSSNVNNVDSDVYIADGDYMKDIEVNDLRNRYTLTKGSTQKMVNTLSCPLILSGTPFPLHGVVWLAHAVHHAFVCFCGELKLTRLQ